MKALLIIMSTVHGGWTADVTPFASMEECTAARSTIERFMDENNYRTAILGKAQYTYCIPIGPLP